MTYPDILAALARERSATVQAEAEAACWALRRASQMTATATGLATTACQELAAAPHADLITPGVRGQEGALGPVSQRC